MHERSAEPQATQDLDAPGDDAIDATPAIRIEIVVAAMVCVGVLVALAAIALFQTAPEALTALGVGVLLALALDPVLRATQRRFDCSRLVGTLIVGSSLTIVLAAVVFVLGPQAVDQAEQFADDLPSTIEELYTWPVIGSRLEQADAVGKVEQFVDDLPSRVDADSITDAASRLVAGLASAALVLVTAVAILLDGEALVARVRSWIRPERRERADEIGRIVYQSVARYFAGSVAVAVLNGLVILTTGLILGVPLAPLAAVWAMITNLIPQIGGFLGGGFFVLLASTQGAVPALIALGVFLVYQQFENNVIQPTVIGRAVDLTPPTTMLAALVGGAAAGVPGALVATPLIGAAKSVWLDTRGDDDAPADEASSDAATDGTASDDRTDDGERPSALKRVVAKVTNR